MSTVKPVFVSPYNPVPVSPVTFAKAMRDHWEKLDNVSSDALMQLWQDMGSAFSRAILVGSGSMKGNLGEEHQWQILQPPTGTGKTQGACVYAAMVAEQNLGLPEGGSRTGVLMVTRTIKDADGLAATINKRACFKCAVARHSENKLPREEMAKHDILVITHQAYLNALEDRVLNKGEDRLQDFIDWEEGSRFLTIIDENLEQLVKTYQVSEEDLRLTYATMESKLRRDFTWIANDIDMHSEMLTKFDGLDKRFGTKKTTDLLWKDERRREGWKENKLLIMELRRRMSRIKYDDILISGEDPSIRKRTAQRIDRTLEAYEAIGSGFAFSAMVGGKQTYNTARLIMPEDLPGPVVLDATAKQEVLWELIGKRAHLRDPVPNVRSYRNVRLHVSRSRATGKQSMVKYGQQRITSLFDSFGNELQDKKVFLCVHKNIEPLVQTYAPSFAECSVDHWGNIDGRNDWKDFDVAILLGLSFRPQTWVKNKVYAVIGVETEYDALSITSAKRQRYLNETLTRQLSISINPSRQSHSVSTGHRRER